MKPNEKVTFERPADLQRVGERLLGNYRKQGELDEAVQLSTLLLALRDSKDLAFPLTVEHLGLSGGAPDFHLQSGSTHIGIEIAKVTTRQYEMASAHQAPVEGPDHFGNVLICHQVLREHPDDMTRRDVLDAAFSPGQFTPSLSVREELDFWTRQVKQQLDDKQQVLGKPHFRRGAQNWLVLVDRFSTAHSWIVAQRAAALSNLLGARWGVGWFDRVFLQSHGAPWSWHFDHAGHSRLSDAALP